MSPQQVFGIRFVIDREECFSHDVKYVGDAVHVSFVVIKSDSSWHNSDDGIDLVVKFSRVLCFASLFIEKARVILMHKNPWLFELFISNRSKGPNGEQIHDFRDKINEKHEFVAREKGVHRFWFINKSPYHETIDFDIHVAHFSYYEEHANDKHLKPLIHEISRLEDALYNIQFEQHWLEAQTERQALINDAMGRRAVQKALFESAALVGVSILQVFLLRRLFERKLGVSRV